MPRAASVLRDALGHRLPGEATSACARACAPRRTSATSSGARRPNPAARNSQASSPGASASTRKARGSVRAVLRRSVIMPGVRSIGLATETSGVTQRRDAPPASRRRARGTARPARSHWSVQITPLTAAERRDQHAHRPAATAPVERAQLQAYVEQLLARIHADRGELAADRVDRSGRLPASRPVCASAARPLASRRAALQHDHGLAALARVRERVDERVGIRTGLRHTPR